MRALNQHRKKKSDLSFKWLTRLPLAPVNYIMANDARPHNLTCIHLVITSLMNVIVLSPHFWLKTNVILCKLCTIHYIPHFDQDKFVHKSWWTYFFYFIKNNNKGDLISNVIILLSFLPGFCVYSLKKFAFGLLLNFHETSSCFCDSST